MSSLLGRDQAGFLSLALLTAQLLPPTPVSEAGPQVPCGLVYQSILLSLSSKERLAAGDSSQPGRSAQLL